MPTAAFRFGPSDEHEFKIVCGIFGGERYFVDGNLIHSRWSPNFSGLREFTAGGHIIQIRVSTNLRGAFGEAFVDGELKEKDLFAEFNARIRRKQGRPLWFIRAAVWLVLVLVFFAAFKACNAAT